MSLTQTVTSSFNQCKNQLFYEAKLSNQTKKVTLRVFNHTGVQKIRRYLSFPQQIQDIFAVDQYLIGLDSTHTQLTIIDITKFTFGLVTGILPDHKRLHQRMKQKRLKFTYFCYDHTANLIFGILDNHEVFYFKITWFTNGNNHSDSSFNETGKIQIKSVYLCHQPINKFQVRNTRRPKANQINQRNQRNQQSYIANITQNQVNDFTVDLEPLETQNVTDLCLLISQKHIMRVLQMDWQKDIPKKIVVTERVYDFCMKNGWDLIIHYKSNVNIKNEIKKQKHQCQMKTTTRGEYNCEIELSNKHLIFCSDQSLLIVDREVGSISGVYHKEFHQVKQCQSIPENLTLDNTMLKVERADQVHLKYIFQTFNIEKEDFKYTSLLVPLYDYAESKTQEEFYLKRNIDRVFSPNGLIYPKFKSMVERYLKGHQRNQSSVDSQNNSLIQKTQKIQKQNQQNKMKRQDSYLSVTLSQIDSRKLAKLFLQKFIMTDKNLLNILMNSLLNSSPKTLFGIKKYYNTKPTQIVTKTQNSIKQKQNRSQNRNQNQETIKISNYSSFADILNKNKKEQLQDKQSHIHSTRKQSYQMCNFQYWNDYFEEMIYKQMATYKRVIFGQVNQKSQQNGLNQDSSSSSNSSISRVNTIEQLFQGLHRIKQRLALISNIYNRFNKLFSTMSFNLIRNESHNLTKNQPEDLIKQEEYLDFIKQQQKIRQNIQRNHFKVIQNTKKCRSLFLIYDMLAKSLSIVNRDDKQLGNKQKKSLLSLTVFKKILQSIFKKLSSKREGNIQQWKRINELLSSTLTQNNTAQSIPFLLFHQHFQKSRLLISTSQSSLLTFEQILQYLLLNINQFEQVAYFYYLFTVQSERKLNIIQQTNKAAHSKRKSIINQSLSQQSCFIVYPYVSKDLVRFFEIVENIPVYINKSSKKIQYQKDIQKLAQLCLKINKIQFVNHVIQLCCNHSLPTILVKLVLALPSLNIQSNKNHLYQQQRYLRTKQGNNEISQQFIKNQVNLIKSLLNCSPIINKNHENYGKSTEFALDTNGLVLTSLKRILNVCQALHQQDPIPATTISKEKGSPKRQSNKIGQIQCQKQGQIPGQILNDAVDIRVKEYLLLKLVQQIQIKQKQCGSFFNSCRLLHQIRDQLLKKQEDKQIIHRFIGNLIKNKN